MNTPSKHFPFTLRATTAAPVDGLQADPQVSSTSALLPTIVAEGLQYLELKRAKQQKLGDESDGSSQEAAADDTEQQAEAQLSFDFGMVEGFAWNLGNNDAELSEYLAVGEDYSPAEYALFGEQGSEVTIAGIRPVPLAAPREEINEGAPIEQATKSDESSNGASTSTAPATQGTEAKTEAPAPLAPNQDAISEQTPSGDSKSNTPSGQDGPPVWVAGFALLGLGGGGGGGGVVQSITESVQFIIGGKLSLGVVKDPSALVLEAFNGQTGVALKGYGAISVGGQFTFSVTEAYQGVVVLRVSDKSDSSDYMDEGTGELKDLTIDMRVMFEVDGKSDPLVAINPLTELAVRKLIGGGGDKGQSVPKLGEGVQPAEVAEMNSAIAKAFGLSGDLVSTMPVTVDDPAFSSSKEYDAQAYGRVLAGISGMEANATDSTSSILDLLAQKITVNGASVTMAADAIEALLLGAQTADAQPGNAAGSAAVLNMALDGVGPKLVSIVAVPSASPPLAAQEGIQLEIQFDAAVVVDTEKGTPVLPVTLSWSNGSGSYAGVATYVSGSGSDVLTFAYSVDVPELVDASVKLLVADNALNLSGAVMRDAVGNLAEISHAAYVASAAYAVDTVAPVISQVAIAGAQGMKNELLNTGDRVSIVVGLSEPLAIDTSLGLPSLNVKVGDQTVSAMFDQLSESKTEISFVLTVLEGQLDGDGISIDANALSLGDAVLTDVAGNPLKLESLAVAANATYQVDAVAPPLSTRPQLDTADDTGLKDDDYITSRMAGLTFSGTVKSQSSSTVAYESKATVVLFDDANGNSLLDDGETLATTETNDSGEWRLDVSLAEGTHDIRAFVIDSAGNPGKFASEPANVVVDNTAPVIKQFSSPNESGAYQAGETVTIEATASEKLVAGGRILVALSTGESVVLTAQGDTTLLSGAYKISTTAFTGDLSVVSYQDVPQAAVKDLAGKALASVGVDSSMPNIPEASIIVDTVAPRVLDVALVAADGGKNGWLNAGDVVRIDVKMSEVVILGSSATPTLSIAIDAFGADSKKVAKYVSGSGTQTLRFEYTIVDGDVDVNGIAIGAGSISLNQATLQDAAGNDATLTFGAVAADPNFRVQTKAPEINGLTIPDQAMSVGDTVQVILNVSDDGGVAYDDIEANINGFELTNLKRIDSTNYSVEFTVADGGADVAASADIPVSVVLFDVAGNGSEEFTAPILGAADRIDANTPRLSQVKLASSSTDVLNNALSEGDSLVLSLTFSEAVYVTGVPSFPVAVGSALVSLNYVSGDGTATLTFAHDILPGETDTDGITFLADALLLNGGRIQDASGMDASLTHAALSSGGYIIDTTAPLVLSFYTDTPTGEYKRGSQINVYAEMSEAVSDKSELVVNLNTNALLTLRTMDGDPSLMVGTYVVASGENTNALKVAGIVTAGVYDLAGNVIIEGDLPDLNLPTSGDHQSQPGPVIIDTILPFTPNQLELDAAGNTGTKADTQSYSDGVTSQTSNLGLSTRVELGSVVRLYDGSALLSTETSIDGDWSIHVNLSEGSHSLRVTSTDAAGNVSGASATLTLLIDTTAPQVTALEVLPGTGAVGQRLNAGDKVQVVLAMSEATYVHLPSGAVKPSVQLDIGGTLVRAEYQSGSGTNSLTFDAVIGASMRDDDGITIVSESLSAGGATLTDVAGNVANLSHGAALVTESHVLVDNTGPSIVSVSFAGKESATGVLVWQDKVFVDIAFNESVLVKQGAAPTLALKVGSQLVSAAYASGSGGSNLRFEYVLGANLTDTNGMSIPASQFLAAVGDVTDLSGNKLVGSTYSAVADDSNYVVDATPPTVDSITFLSATGMEDGWINVGDTMRWKVSLDESVTISGTPKLRLDVGGQDVDATYVVGSGNKDLIFEVTFTAGVQAHGGVVIGANSLFVEGGALRDGQGNATDLSHAAVPALADYPVDTLSPHIVEIRSTTPDGWYKAGTSIQITAVFNENLVSPGGTVTAVLDTGESVILKDWNNTNALSGTYVVGATSNSVDLKVTSIKINSAPVDSAANVMMLEGVVDGLGLVNLNVARDIVVDTRPPSAPSKPDLDDFDDTGSSEQDNRTNVAEQTKFTGTAEAYSTVTLFNDLLNDGKITVMADEYLGEVIAGEDNTWSIQLPTKLIDGDYVIRAVATDRAGNQGAVSEGVSVTVDTEKPVIESVVLRDEPLKVGSQGVLTITVADDGENDIYYQVQGSVNGFALGQLSKLTATTYEATFTVTEGGHDVAANESINVLGLSVDDSAGNRSDAFSTTISQGKDAIDANSPQVSSVTISGADGNLGVYLNKDDVVYVTVKMTEAMTVSGTPQLKLEIGDKATPVLASYVGPGNLDTDLIFAYTIVDRNDADGISIPANALVLPSGAAVTDLAGNNAVLDHAAVSDDGNYLVDTQLPDVPLQVDLDQDDDVGVWNNDNITSRTANLSFGGTAEVGSSVTLFDDQNDNGIVDDGEEFAFTPPLIADASGNWSAQLGLSEDDYKIRVIATDAAGNESEASEVLDLRIDTTAPEISSVEADLSVISTNGYLKAGEEARVILTVSEAVEVVTQYGTPSVKFNIGGTEVEALYLRSLDSTHLVFGFTILDGLNDTDGISVVLDSLKLNSSVITDLAGNGFDLLASGSVANQSFDDSSQMVDTTKPNMPTDLILAPEDYSGTNGYTNLTNGLSFSLSDPLDDTAVSVQLYANADPSSQELGELVSDDNVVGGLWTPAGLDLSEGDYVLRAVATDEAGNQSDPSEPLILHVDTTKPAVPDLTLSAASDTGDDDTDGITQTQSQVTLTWANAQEGETIKVYEVGVGEVATTVMATNTIRLDVQLSEGIHEFYATATDQAGNTSYQSDVFTVEVDITAPLAPSGLSLDSADDHGISDSDQLTNQSSALTLMGTAEADATVSVYDDADNDGEVTMNEWLDTVAASKAGVWTFDMSLAPDVDHHIRAMATDAAGNKSGLSAPLDVYVDVTAPRKALAESIQSWDVASAPGFSRGDVLRLEFSEDIQVERLSLSDLEVTSGHELGTGALLQAEVPEGGFNGLSKVFWITLGEGATIVAGDEITLASTAVVDKAGNPATSDVVFALAQATTPTLTLADTSVELQEEPPTAPIHWVGVGLTAADQYEIDDAVLYDADVRLAISGAHSFPTVNESDTFVGSDGMDVFSLYGTVNLIGIGGLSSIERLQVYGDVTITVAQLQALNDAGASIEGDGAGILRIVEDPNELGNTVDLSRLRLANLAQLDIANKLTVSMTQDNLDQIAAISTGPTNTYIQAVDADLNWQGVTVFGRGEALGIEESANLGSLLSQAGAVNGEAIFEAVQDSLSEANALLLATTLLSDTLKANYVQDSTLTAQSFDAISWGQSTAANSLAAFGAERHWLIGGGVSDLLVAGGGGDVLWAGSESLPKVGTANTLIGGDLADIAIAGNNPDTFDMGAGDDYVDAGDGTGADTIRGGEGNDFIRSGNGADVIQFEKDVATNGVDLLADGFVGDLFDFSLMAGEGTFIGLNTESMWRTTTAGLSSLASSVGTDAYHNEAFIVLTDTVDEASTVLQGTKFNPNGITGSRVLVWADSNGLVEMALVRNTDTGTDVEVDVFAHLMLTTSDSPTAFLLGLADAHFVV